MVISGSPGKNGSTNTVVNWFVEGEKEAGADVALKEKARQFGRTLAA